MRRVVKVKGLTGVDASSCAAASLGAIEMAAAEKDKRWDSLRRIMWLVGAFELWVIVRWRFGWVHDLGLWVRV